MIKHWLGKLFGIQAEIDALNLRVKELSWDEPFGMLTRNGFLQHCHEMKPKVRRVVFIDLDDIGDLNIKLGYTEVDRRIKSIFRCFRNSNEVVARWYSGDEIVLLFDDLSNSMQRIRDLHNTASALGVTFAYETGIWRKMDGKSIDLVVNSLSARVCQKKTALKEPPGGVICE